MFAPGFEENVRGAGVAELANRLVNHGFAVLVHAFFAERGDVFDTKVRITARQLRMSELLALFDTAKREAEPQRGTVPARGTEPQRGTESEAPSAADPQPVTASASQAWPGRHPAPAARTKQPVVARNGRVVAVASAKGGVGKTSVTVNLAAYAARHLQGRGLTGTVVLLDTNVQQADVGRYLNLRAPTVLDLLKAPGTLTGATVRNHLALVPEIGLYALLGPPDAVNADPALINAAQYLRILAVLRRAFDFVFIDTPVAELYHTTFTDLILPEADAILVPIEPSRVTLETARSWLRAITMPQHSRRGGVPPEKLSLVLNRARVDVGCSPEEVMDLMPGWRFAGMIPDDEEWVRAVNDHRLIALHAAPELEATFRGILQVVTGDPNFGVVADAPPATGTASRVKRLLGLPNK